MRHLPVWLILIGAACSNSSPPPPPDSLPPVDLGAPELAGASDGLHGASNVFSGTCLEAVVACFDPTLPCTQSSVGPGMTGFTATFANGAVFILNTSQGTASATNSHGEVCFSVTTDPGTADILYKTPAGMIRERDTPSGRQITCPNGTVQSAPAGDSPWIAASNDCSV
jgi:hypothetical protein